MRSLGLLSLMTLMACVVRQVMDGLPPLMGWRQKILTDRERERWAQQAEGETFRDPLLIALAHEVQVAGNGSTT
jgi:hypothetical protein